MKLTRYEKREMVRTAAEIIDSETGGRAQPLGQERVQSTKGGGRAFYEWAIDMKSCGAEVFPFYLATEDDARPLSHKERETVRQFWLRVRKKRGLIANGLWIMAQMGHESINILRGNRKI